MSAPATKSVPLKPKLPAKKKTVAPKPPTMKPIPITAAKAIAKAYGYDQVVILGRRVGDDPAPHGEHLTTYGVTKVHCAVAAQVGQTLRKFMGWDAKEKKG